MVLRGFLKFIAVFLIASLILILILGAVGFFAIRNFDPNMFRAEFEKYLTQKTGFRVELGSIDLRWRPQPQLQVEGIKFYAPGSLDMILQSEQVQIDMDLTSIWKKRFNMSQAVIQSPEIFLKRDREGLWNWQFSQSPQGPVAASRPASSPMSLIPTAEASEGAETPSLGNLYSFTQGWEFGIGKILVRNATVHYEDQTTSPAYQLNVEKIEAEVRQETSSLFHFEASGAALNSAKRDLEVEAEFDLRSRSLDFVLRYGPEFAEFKGKLKLKEALPYFEGVLMIRNLDMDSVIPAVYKEGAYVTGRLSAKAQPSFQGANPDRIKRSLSGQGTLEIKEGALRNRNLVKEVFEKLSSVLAIMNSLGGELPPELNEMLKDRDTPFESLQAVYAVQSGVFQVSELRLVHSNFQLSGRGSYGLLDDRIEGSMQLLLSKTISAHLTKKIQELAYLADRSGEVMIPFRCSGVFPDVSVQPDLPYIASRALQGGGDQLMNRGMEQLSKILGSKNAGQASTVDPAVSGSPEAVSGAGQTSSAKPLSQTDQLIQQGMALFSKYQEAQGK